MLDMQLAYIIEEDTRIVMYASEPLRRELGYDPAGQVCYQALAGKTAPCTGCLHADKLTQPYGWEYLGSSNGKYFKITNRCIDEDGRRLRLGIAEEVSDLVRLNRSVVDYLALMKTLSELQSQLIENQERTLELVLQWMLQNFSAVEANVLYPVGEGWELLRCREGAKESERLPLSSEQACPPDILALPYTALMVLDKRYLFRLVGPRAAAAWSENAPILFHVVKLYLESAALREMVRWDSIHDKLTGLYNRAHFTQIAHSRYCACSQLGIVYLDLDNLKQINDEFGHLAGDRALQRAANALCTVSGERIHAYRMGGDEFMLVCCDMVEEQVQALMDRIDQALIEKQATEAPPLSLSMGYAHQRCPFQMEDLVAAADQQMYVVKRKRKLGQ